MLDNDKDNARRLAPRFFGSGAAGLGWIKALCDRSASDVAVQRLRLFHRTSLARQPRVPGR
jgi:hypothetical protein